MWANVLEWISLVGIAGMLLQWVWVYWRSRTERVIHWDVFPPQVMIEGIDAGDLKIEVGNEKITSLTKYIFEVKNRGRKDIEWAEASDINWTAPGPILMARNRSDEDRKWRVNLDYKVKEKSIGISWVALRKKSAQRLEVVCDSAGRGVGELKWEFPNTPIHVKEPADFDTIDKDVRRLVRQRVWSAIIVGLLISVYLATLQGLQGYPIVMVLAGFLYTIVVTALVYWMNPVHKA